MVYLIALAEWGLTPEYINENWTEELLALMFVKRKEYLATIRPGQPQQASKQTHARVDNQEFFKRHGIRPKPMPRKKD